MALVAPRHGATSNVDFHLVSPEVSPVDDDVPPIELPGSIAGIIVAVERAISIELNLEFAPSPRPHPFGAMLAGAADEVLYLGLA